MVLVKLPSSLFIQEPFTAENYYETIVRALVDWYYSVD